MIKRFFEIKKESGIKVAVAKAVKYAPVIILKNIGQRLFEMNSQRYWDYRLLFNWTSAGGDKQTQDFAESFIENVDRSYVEFGSILDFGCALGDSASVFRRLSDDLEIYLWDISEVGLSKAIKRNQNSRVIRWDKTKKVELVYCSNVIEHVLDTEALINKICAASKKWVCIQAPYREVHANGEKITPSNPNGEHIWTIDDDFIEKKLNLPIFSETRVFTGYASQAWPFGKQIYFIGRIP